MHDDENMSAFTPAEQVEKAHEDTVDISSFSTTKGEQQEERRSKRVRAKKSVIVNAETIAIFTHPLGKEFL
ncbi:unnamed protein product [Scytosiphon promiscuus]